MKINDALDKYGRFFIIPMDHPLGPDTPKLESLGVQQLINRLESFDFDGYIFHARQHFMSPYMTSKDYFVTVGEGSENYKADIEEVVLKVPTKKVTIFYEIRNPEDEYPIEFFKNYIIQLKEAGFLVMAISFPGEDAVGDVYPHIVEVAKELDVDILKTDYCDEIKKLDLGKLKLCIGGGPLIPKDDFEQLVMNVASLNKASYSFGRNIFEAENYKDRVELILRNLER
jgi:hypothetical protein